MADQSSPGLAHADDARLVAEMAIANAQGLAVLYDRHAAPMRRIVQLGGGRVA